MLNQLKTVLVMSILAAASYGMYVLIWQKPKSLSTPAESPPAMNSAASSSAVPSPPVISSPLETFSPPQDTGGGSIATGLNSTVSPAAPNLPPPAPPATLPPVVSLGPSPGQPASRIEDPQEALPVPPVEKIAPSPASAPPALEELFQDRFTKFMEEVWKTLDEGRLPEAHLALSKLYEDPNLPETQRRQITELLDQLAGTVIYSRQHYLEPPHVVRPGETLEQIAAEYHVPALLLARINGIEDLRSLEPGQELKVIRGPFRAVIHLDRHELTLMVQERYAGRFPIGIGVDCPKLEGEYTVFKKTTDPVYCGFDGVSIPPGDVRNPLGKYWIGLSDQIGLHGTNDAQNVGRDNSRGTLCLGNRDIDDLYGILSIGSRVVIQR